MLNLLLVVQLIVGILLIALILLQKTAADGLSGLGGGNSGVVSSQSANSFFKKSTMFLAAVFLVNSIILANLSARDPNKELIIDNNNQKENTGQSKELPVAK
jgi:preprotein translocase subunit SecG